MIQTFGLNAALVRAPQVSGPQHQHQEVELNYLFSGGVTYLHRWQRRALPLRKLVAFWAAPPHCVVEVEPGTEMAWVTVPLPWVLQSKVSAPFVRRLLDGGWCEEMREEEAPERYPFRAWVEEIKAGEEAAITLELQAALVRLAVAGKVKAGRAGASVLGEGWRGVEVMARFMAEHFAEEIGVREIATAAGLHPKYAMAVFKRACGTTIGDYLRQYRVTHAQRLLITTEAKVLEVALASGFGSASVFYETFQHATGTTPTEFRRSGLG